jgi:hypothetical protein
MTCVKFLQTPLRLFGRGRRLQPQFAPLRVSLINQCVRTRRCGRPERVKHQIASMRGGHDAVPAPTMMKPSGWRWNPPEEGRDVRLLGLCLCVVSASVIATMALNVVGRVFIDVNSRSTGWNFVDAIIKDDYYVYALPTLIPGCITYVYFNWLASQFFAHT